MKKKKINLIEKEPAFEIANFKQIGDESPDDKFRLTLNGSVYFINNLVDYADYCNDKYKIDNIEENKKRLQNNYENYCFAVRGYLNSLSTIKERKVYILKELTQARQSLKGTEIIENESNVTYIETKINFLPLNKYAYDNDPMVRASQYFSFLEIELEYLNQLESMNDENN